MSRTPSSSWDLLFSPLPRIGRRIAGKGTARVVIATCYRYFPHMNDPGPSVVVNEVYASIQGESSYAGLPCVFVRLTGCNLRCTYCDTEYAFFDGERRSVADLVEQVRGLSIPLVEITGGEPLIQKDCVALAGGLLGAGLTVLIETSGAQPIDVLPAGVIRIMDIKCPSSGECDKMDWSNIDCLKSQDEVKFVIGNREDYEWAKQVIRRHDLSAKCAILISTVYGGVSLKDVAGRMLEDKLPARFQLQMHKYIWDPAEHGV